MRSLKSLSLLFLFGISCQASLEDNSLTTLNTTRLTGVNLKKEKEVKIIRIDQEINYHDRVPDIHFTGDYKGSIGSTFFYTFGLTPSSLTVKTHEKEFHYLSLDNLITTTFPVFNACKHAFKRTNRSAEDKFQKIFFSKYRLSYVKENNKKRFPLFNKTSKVYWSSRFYEYLEEGKFNVDIRNRMITSMSIPLFSKRDIGTEDIRKKTLLSRSKFYPSANNEYCFHTQDDESLNFSSHFIARITSRKGNLINVPFSNDKLMDLYKTLLSQLFEYYFNVKNYSSFELAPILNELTTMNLSDFNEYRRIKYTNLKDNSIQFAEIQVQKVVIDKKNLTYPYLIKVTQTKENGELLKKFYVRYEYSI